MEAHEKCSYLNKKFLKIFFKAKTSKYDFIHQYTLIYTSKYEFSRAKAQKYIYIYTAQWFQLPKVWS